MTNFLHEKYDVFSRQGGLLKNYFIDLVPKYISNNLRHELREYQKEGIGRYIHYWKHDVESKMLSEQLLFNMATGSGKTMMMAALILEKYKQGERNFLFFVDNTNIIEKTRANFLDSSSSKYLFSDSIMIDDELVEIREVTDFSDSQEDAINFVFTTIQKLHTDLNTPKENRLSYEQFEEISVVMLADEAHHLNAGLNADEKKDNASWTATVGNILRSAQKASIFEFTATIDLTNNDIVAKYKDHLIYKYDLKEFRLDGYSKDVLFHLVDNEMDVRMLQAILISQYRKKIALKNGINLKPLILFKSQKKASSAENLKSFLGMLNTLSTNQIEDQKQSSAKIEGILTQAFEYFAKEGITHENLISELQEDFREERLMLIDSNHKTSEKLVELNTLESPLNEIRAIFAVDMLNEGWDVLNLFDIVRLYDIRDGKTTKTGFKPGATTNAEKQLIGRGARYYPFIYQGDVNMKYKRKFDYNESEELRVIEQLHYHSKDNPRYISELKQVLRESGIYDDQTMVERKIKLKRSFRKTRTYKNGVVWVNDRISKPSGPEVQSSLFGFELRFPENLEVQLPTHGIGDFSVFEGEDRQTFSVKQTPDTRELKLKEISSNVIRAGINLKNKDFNFAKLAKSYVGLPSMDAFIQELQDNVKLIVSGDETDVKNLSQENKLYIVKAVLQEIADDVINIEEEFVGTEKFEPKPIKEVFEKTILRKYVTDPNSNKEFGMSQKDLTETRIYEDIDNLDWYAYTDNFGTSEEKLVIRTIKHHMDALKTKLTDIFLLRNEKAVRIYNFEDGRAFEPDFVMFANDAKDGNISWQFFIEPKGGQFLDADGKFDNGKEGWKQNLLKQITIKDKEGVLLDDKKYRVVGLPFYNYDRTRNDFVSELKGILGVEDIPMVAEPKESVQYSLFESYEELPMVAEQIEFPNDKKEVE
ncbi:DEAD/DEAH box helicase family protein [Bacillus thuringiensis]|uniref:DEAD/DEAH box helicase family protein n=1 Tax=Bacillus thuringiensis TaxID=1428 RepID=UPI0009BB7E77|nr:DEAD/DEAH box helicase family protein [Bacillus thuringiensis]